MIRLFRSTSKGNRLCLEKAEHVAVNMTVCISHAIILCRFRLTIILMPLNFKFSRHKNDQKQRWIKMTLDSRGILFRTLSFSMCTSRILCSLFMLGIPAMKVIL